MFDVRLFCYNDLRLIYVRIGFRKPFLLVYNERGLKPKFSFQANPPAHKLSILKLHPYLMSRRFARVNKTKDEF